MYKLFLSFSRLFDLLQDGKVTLNDLRDPKSLFYFGCVRDHVLGEIPSLNEIKENFKEYKKENFTCNEWLTWKSQESLGNNYSLVKEFRAILVRAETENRVYWREKGTIDDYTAFEGTKKLLIRFDLWLLKYDIFADNLLHRSYGDIQEMLADEVEVLF